MRTKTQGVCSNEYLASCNWKYCPGRPAGRHAGVVFLIYRQKARMSTGSPSSKCEHRRASALLRNIQNIRICMGKKPIVSVTYENERISIKTAYLTYKCVLRLHCVVHGSIMAVLSNPYILNVTQQCRCSPTLILRAWATCGMSITCEIVQVARSVASRPRTEHCAR